MNPPAPRPAVSERMLRAFIVPRTNPRRGWGILCAMILAIGVSDYLSGTDASLAIFYLVPVLLATGWHGARAGISVAAVCTVTRMISDWLVVYPAPPGVSLFWNAFASFLIALVVVWLLDALLNLHRALESKITERTAELEHAVAERARLERELLETSARERSAFGRELHDEVGQHLVATALAVQALAQRLTGPLATEAIAIVEWTEQAVAKTRNLARGLLLAEISPDRLIAELEELSLVARHAGLKFEFVHDGAPVGANRLECAQLFRIAQEALSNAVRHAHATRLKISVAHQAGIFYLAIEDDGIGIPRAQPATGMGLHIMMQRARSIGAQLTVELRQPRGTRVTCALPAAPALSRG